MLCGRLFRSQRIAGLGRAKRAHVPEKAEKRKEDDSENGQLCFVGFHLYSFPRQHAG